MTVQQIHKHTATDADAERLLGNYEFFVKQLWLDRKLDRVAPLGEVELDIARWTANGPEQGGPATRGVLAWRGIGKTHITTATYPLWRLCRDPDTKILILSKTLDEAKKTLSLMRTWIKEVWFLEHLDPSNGANNRNTAQALDVGGSSSSRTPSISVLGIEGQLPSKRAHVIIADDVETPDNTKTLDARNELSEKIREFRAIASYGHKETIYVGTYHHEESVYTKLADRGFEFRAWPILYPKKGERVPHLAPMLADKLEENRELAGAITCPHRLTEADIAEYHREGRTWFAMQLMLIPSISGSDRYPIRLEDLIVTDIDRDQAPVKVMYGQRTNAGPTVINDIPCYGFGDDKLFGPAHVSTEVAPFIGTKAGLDPAGRGSDKTGLAITSSLSGMIFVKGVYGLPGGSSEEDLDRIALLLKKHGARELVYEGNVDTFGTLEQALSVAIRRHAVAPGQDFDYPQGWSCSIRSIHATVRKETRIVRTLEPVISGHRMVIDRKALDPREEEDGTEVNQSLQYQLTRIQDQPKCLAEDGQIDALQIAVKAWDHVVRIDPRSAGERRQEQILEDQMREHRKLASEVGPKKRPNFFGHR